MSLVFLEKALPKHLRTQQSMAKPIESLQKLKLSGDEAILLIIFQNGLSFLLAKTRKSEVTTSKSVIFLPSLISKDKRYNKTCSVSLKLVITKIIPNVRGKTNKTINSGL